jgi:hypothetical protein
VNDPITLVSRLAKIWEGCTSVTIESWAKDGYADALRKVVAVAEAAVARDAAMVAYAAVDLDDFQDESVAGFAFTQADDALDAAVGELRGVAGDVQP